MKGQTWIEFIIATIIFLLSISFIFITASNDLKEEAQKSEQQTACLKTYELENILSKTGEPTNWVSSFTVFGLSENNSKPLVVSHNKWQAAKNLGFANVSQNSTPSQSWEISYIAWYANGTSINDSFGAYPPPNALICTTKMMGVLNFTNEKLLAEFELSAW